MISHGWRVPPLLQKVVLVLLTPSPVLVLMLVLVLTLVLLLVLLLMLVLLLTLVLLDEIDVELPIALLAKQSSTTAVIGNLMVTSVTAPILVIDAGLAISLQRMVFNRV